MKTLRTPLAPVAALLAIFALVPELPARPNPHAALDCSYCHLDTPLFGVDTRDTVTFWRDEGDDPRLCGRCHVPDENFHPIGVAPGPERLGTRTPQRLPLGESEAVRGRVVCTTCHFIHAPDADTALLRGFTGAGAPPSFTTWQQLCRECHGEGLGKRSPHAGDERSCAFCHSSKPQAGQPATLTPAGRKLCTFCHGSHGEGHYAGANPFKERLDCTGCHDPHLGKDSPGRLKAGYFDSIRDEVTLNPHARRTRCFACHADGKPGTLRLAETVALCQRCHGSGKITGMSHPLAKPGPGTKIPQGWPLAGGSLTCLTCHTPGHPPGALSGRPDESAGARHLLRGGSAGASNAVCFTCHDSRRWTGRNPHREVALQKSGCSQCHAAEPVWGRDRADTVSFVADVNILCLACHGPADHPGGVDHTVKLTAATPAVPETLPLGSGRRITCATCHNPHLDQPAGHLLRGAKEPTAFCQRCHQL